LNATMVLSDGLAAASPDMQRLIDLLEGVPT
jgi:hypothetical protein